MNWYWKVRIYNPKGNYGTGQVITLRNLDEINRIQDFYQELTGCKMFLEGMSDTHFEGVNDLETVFFVLFQEKP